MPAKGATHILPKECCDRVKRRESMRRRSCRFVRQARIPGWGERRAVKMAEGRRAGPHECGRPAGPQAVVRPGPGRTKKIGGTSKPDAGSGLLGDGKRRKADHRSDVLREG